MDKLTSKILSHLLQRPHCEYLSVVRIALQLDLHESTVRRHLKRLVAVQLITCERPYPGVPYSIRLDRERAKQYVNLPRR